MIKATYRHYKGGLYRLISDNVRMESTGEILCVYECCTTGAVYARPHAEFFGAVNLNGQAFSRFVKI